MASISRRASSAANASRSAAAAALAAVVGMPMQIECSDDACEMSDTETPARSSAPNARAATPGTPTMPFPAIVSNV